MTTGKLLMSKEASSLMPRLEARKKAILQLPISEGNRRLIVDFADCCLSEGLGPLRILKYIGMLKTMATMEAFDFEKANRADIEQLAAKIESSPYTEWTKHDFRVAIKRFYKWLRGTEDGYPPEVKWLRSTARRSRCKLPEEILTQDEVRVMIAAATSPRDKAFIAVLYESGCRIAEQLGLRMRQIQADPHGFRMTVFGKTGSRRLLLIASGPYLAEWLNSHPRAGDPEAHLWAVSERSAEPLSHSRVRAILLTIADRARVRKAVNPHNFRHSRATHLAMHLTEAQMNEYFGWVQGSGMAQTYVHLSGRDMDSALLKLHNIQTPDEKQAGDGFSLRPCSRCDFQNPPANRFCSRCGTALDDRAADDLIRQQFNLSRVDGVMDRLVQDSEFREMLQRKISELCTSAAGFSSTARNL
jgi:site-specific recombinase XerD